MSCVTSDFKNYNWKKITRDLQENAGLNVNFYRASSVSFSAFRLDGKNQNFVFFRPLMRAVDEDGNCRPWTEVADCQTEGQKLYATN